MAIEVGRNAVLLRMWMHAGLACAEVRVPHATKTKTSCTARHLCVFSS